VAQAEMSRKHQIINRNEKNSQILTNSKIVDLCDNFACFLLVGLGIGFQGSFSFLIKGIKHWEGQTNVSIFLHISCLPRLISRRLIRSEYIASQFGTFSAKI
jgi:hypothetical protein